jgi:Family of unknown function (DUF6130)
LSPGPHRVLLELADPMHRVIDHAVVDLVIPEKRQPPDTGSSAS